MTGYVSVNISRRLDLLDSRNHITMASPTNGEEHTMDFPPRNVPYAHI